MIAFRCLFWLLCEVYVFCNVSFYVADWLHNVTLSPIYAFKGLIFSACHSRHIDHTLTLIYWWHQSLSTKSSSRLEILFFDFYCLNIHLCHRRSNWLCRFNKILLRRAILFALISRNLVIVNLQYIPNQFRFLFFNRVILPNRWSFFSSIFWLSLLPWLLFGESIASY